MKQIKINSLDIHYFKGIKNLHIDFGDITTISGDNGLGKTTIADAFFWVLFGKDSLGRTKFRIKTIGEKNVDTYVDVALSIDDIAYTLRKQLITKQNDYGSEQNEEQSVTSKFYVDGQSYTKKDFDIFVNNIISETAFRTITSPTYFFSLKWNEQRALLSSLVDEVSDQDVNRDGEFDLIENVLQRAKNGDIDALAKHISYQMKEIKQKLDTIPVQIAEQERLMPEQQEWDKIEVEIKTLNGELQAKQELLASVKSGASNTANNELRKAIEFQQHRIDEMRESCRRMAKVGQDKYDDMVRADRMKFSEYQQSLSDLKKKLDGLLACISQTKMTIEEQNKAQEKIRKEWAERVNCKFVCPPVNETCPTCGQPLPVDIIEETKQKLLEDFNLRKAEAKKELTERANLSKGTISRAENDLKGYENEITLVQGQQKALNTYIENLQKKLTEYAKQTPKTAQELLAINEGYKDAQKRIADLQAQIDGKINTDNSEVIMNLEHEISETQLKIGFLTSALAERSMFGKCTARISELNESQKELRSQYDELQHQADLCLRYQLRAGEILEERINEHFSYVRFSLFRKLVNGTTEPYCEGYVDGVPYQTNINSAARLNCGLDVCNAFSKKMGISAVVFCDNAESNNHIIPTTGQQVRLYVSDDKTLKIS